MKDKQSRIPATAGLRQETKTSGKPQVSSRKKYRSYAVLAALAVIAAVVVIVQPFQAASSDGAKATYMRGVLHVSIPYEAVRSGSGQLTMEVLNPEGQVLGRMERQLDVFSGKGRWQEDVKLDEPLPPEDLVWHRLRYRFDYSDRETAALEGIESISQIIRTPVVHILGQQSYIAGGEAAIRVIVTDSKNEPISNPGTIQIELLVPEQKPRVLFTGKLNRRGTTEAGFEFPAGLAGNYQLRYVADTSIGSTEFIQSIRLQDKVAILLTTEKPIYQPGQTIHIRALALDRSDHEAAVDRNLTFEVEDSRGNKVFRKGTSTDKFGIAAAEFALADEVNLGTYHLRALMGDPDAPANTAEVALNVDRYVLPKFKVAVDLTGKDNKTRRGYRPGDHVTGTVHANYFFGKAVQDGEITIKASSMDVAVFEVASTRGKTDSDGSYHFDLRLPNYFAGRPLSQGAARVLIEATVKDSAGHAETRGEPITVSESPLLITAVPEGGALVPNLENQVFVLTSYPDGSPASADLTVHAAGNSDQRVTSDSSGVAVVRLNAGSGSEKLNIEAGDKEGNRASTQVQLETRNGQDQILLRTERAIYHAGDRIQLKILSTLKRGTAYVDVVKEGQTVMTRDLDIVNGQAELALAATPDMAGTVDFNAYLFGRNAQPIADHRLVFVQPADELKVEAQAVNAVYKPGEDARIHFHVTNSRGEGVQAALGLQVVDEAVFALAEKQPGFAKVFFYLEQEVMKPRYEIHAIGMEQIAETADEAQAKERDRAAQALFSATEMVTPNKFETEFGRSIPATKYGEYAQRYQKQFMAQVQSLTESLDRSYRQHPNEKDLLKIAAQVDSVRDPWGTSLQITPITWAQGTYLVQSAGPDKKFNTGDEMGAYLEVHHRKLVGHPSSGDSTIDVTVEHDRLAFTGNADIQGTVSDQEGGALEGAVVTLREVSKGKTRVAHANADGKFSLAALPPGSYEVKVSTRTETVSGKVTVDARDRAVLSVFLRHEPSGIVVVANEMFRDRFNRLAMLKEGAAAGGVIDGADMVAVPAPEANQVVEVTAQAVKVETTNTATAAKDDKQPSGAHVRSYFPEALYINPEIITDRDGRASISIPLADSITTWRMALVASTQHGSLGTGTSSLKVFQDFFVDLDLPVTLTQGDRVSIPVAIYNYSGARGDVSLKLQPDDWYALVDDATQKTVSVDSGRVGGSEFTVEAKRIGKFKLMLSANMDGKSSREDIVVREIEVVPNGREQSMVFNGRLENTVQHELNFPASSIPEASKIYVRLYPGPLSQVIEGMDSILAMPGGCFEQTSSSTYPDVLALDYMKRTKKLTPEVHAKAEGFIANGYQRLLTFEVPGGGFSWFGQAPANKILTSYGLMEFSDMAKVHDVDLRVIQRTQQWLAGQQQEDGSWKPDTYFINEGATTRYNTDVLRITAYIAWSLENTGYQGPAVEKAKQFIESHLGGKSKLDAYTLAVLANFAADYGKDHEFTTAAMQLLLDARTGRDEQVWWTADETSVYATGNSASVETTGLAVQALLKWGQASGVTRKALTYLTSQKNGAGNWGTTQATIMALRALLLATDKGAADVRGTVEVLLNGKPMEKLELTPENNDLLHQYVFKSIDAKEASKVELRFDGKGGLAYQVVGSYFTPWDKRPEGEPLTIDVAYDRTRLAQDDIATATAIVKNNMNTSAKMVMVDLGIPPGFDLLSEDLQAYQEKSAGGKSGRLEKFSLTATQAILYFDSLSAGETIRIPFRLRAKYPIRAKTFQSRVYEYYDPEVSSLTRPVQLEVRAR
jgi:hypothetical protein